MSRFNISAWGLKHQALVLYLLLALTLIGLMSYGRLGQSEDPPFTFKIMVVQTQWPGASAEEVATQVTDRIEKKLQELAELDSVRSYSRPGESVVMFFAKEDTPPSAIPQLWYQVRKKVGDIRHTLPEGVIGPSFNDEFGDTYGNIFALQGEGLGYRELKRYADAVRDELLRVPDVAKVNLFGVQEERIYVTLSNERLATLKLSPEAVVGALAGINREGSAGFFELQHERIFVRPSGQFDSVKAVADTVIRIGGESLRLGDVATVTRGYEEPPPDRMRFMGQEAVGVGVSMRAGGDIIALGHHLDTALVRIQSQLPVGVSLSRVADQPRAVSRSVNEFIRVLTEAVLIVLAVSLLSLGLRTGIVVAIIIPVVLAITFLFMDRFGIGLHKISLGALIIALGLLVDDAIIAVEMMATKMEQGWDRAKAASFAYSSTAMPMLSGTLVTAAGFLPIATAASSTGEYTRSIFQVTVIALLISWIAAVLFVPYLGYHLLPDFAAKRKSERLSVWQRGARRLSPRLAAWMAQHHAPDEAHDEYAIYHTAFYNRFRRLLSYCVRHRWLVLAATVLIFVASMFVFGRFVPQQFFPDSTRPELLVDLRLAEGSSYEAAEAEVKELERLLSTTSGIENYVAYVGIGSPRFYLPLDQKLPQTNFAQFVVLTDGPEAREALRTQLIEHFQGVPRGVRAVVNRLENGPPVGFPVQYRISGPDFATLHQLAGKVAGVMRSQPELSNVQTDWGERSKVVNLRVDQEKARLLGLSSSDISQFLMTALNGLEVTEYREGTELIPVLLRGSEEDRSALNRLQDFSITTPNGSVPLTQVVTPELGFEHGLIWRWDRLPTVTVRATLYGSKQPSQVVQALGPKIDAIRAELPLGYRLVVGGAVEESAKGGSSVAAGVPLFILVVLTVLMIQLQSFSRMFMVVLTAPLGMIGVTAALLLFHKPFGFVAMLGTIALSGMIMRNSVILVDQIQQDIAAGEAPWNAVIEATVRRYRPIMLTAAAAILAMIPLTRSAFFGPMAVAIMGGLAVATVLTLLVLPALYAAWYRIRPGDAAVQQVR